MASYSKEAQGSLQAFHQGVGSKLIQNLKETRIRTTE